MEKDCATLEEFFQQIILNMKVITRINCYFWGRAGEELAVECFDKYLFSSADSGLGLMLF